MVKVHLKIDGKSFDYQCDSSQDLLTAARNGFVPLSTGCRRGGCGMCKVAVLKGEFTHKKSSKEALSDVEADQNLALACMMYPTTDLEAKAVE